MLSFFSHATTDFGQFFIDFGSPFLYTLEDKPICRPDQKRIYGVARNEPAEILCEVDAYPAPETFKWSFNNTAETFDMPQSGYRVHSAQASTLTYTPVKTTRNHD
uniref:Ig-like domain-containing protein n=1 Tax=Lutzomyia longipalpis TaxID=7200 RepID=A0A1B0EW11_LUTLO